MAEAMGEEPTSPVEYKSTVALWKIVIVVTYMVCAYPHTGNRSFDPKRQRETVFRSIEASTSTV